MRLVTLYRQDTDYTRDFENWLDEFERNTGKKFERLDPDTREGDNFGKRLEIMEYPTILILDDKGTPLQSWSGSSLPLMDEVSYYAKDM